MRTTEQNTIAFFVSEAAANWRQHLRQPGWRIPLSEFRRYARKAIDLLGAGEFATAFRERAGKLGMDAASVEAGVAAVGAT
jgi:hypothetical protein